jgi:hypothetical protein
MSLDRRTFLALGLAAAAGGVSGGAADAHADPRSALRRAVAWLVAKQHDDGSWRSETYGMMRSGQSLTPFVLAALADAAEAGAAPDRPSVVEPALGFLRKHVGPDGALGRDDPEVLEYPVYSTSYGLLCFTRAGTASDLELAMRMQGYLGAAQYGPATGFDEASSAYGGWGVDKPAKPGRAEHMDLAHTRRALAALAAANRRWPADADFRISMARRAERFLAVVQRRRETAMFQSPTNEASESLQAIPPFDGGFYFSPIVLAANKGRAADGPAPHWRSYATATCDGALALLATGAKLSDPRVEAAARWLREHADVDYPAGIPTDQPDPWGEAVRFYHYAVRAETYRALDFPAKEQSRLAEAVARRQRSDGSFVNLAGPLMKEDDPILCTALAAVALSHAATEED